MEFIMEAYRDRVIFEFFSGLVLLCGLQPILMCFFCLLFFVCPRRNTNARIWLFIFSWHFSHQISSCRKEEFIIVLAFINKYAAKADRLFLTLQIQLPRKLNALHEGQRRSVTFHTTFMSQVLPNDYIWLSRLTHERCTMHSVELMITKNNNSDE